MIGGLSVCSCWLIVSGSFMAGSVFLPQLVVWHQVLAVSGSAAAGFEALGLAAAGLAVVRFMQRRVHHSDAFDT